MKREAKRFNVLACGRRWGKTVLAEDLLVEPALRGYPVAYFAPTYRMLAEVWRDMHRVLQPAAQRVNTQENRIELATGGLVEMWSLEHPDVARGRKYKRVVVDEAAMIRQLETAWTAVIRPTLMDYEGDAWFKSTPKGRNYFWRLYEAGQDPARPDWNSWQMPTASNPFIRASEIDEMRRNLPERIFAQEVMAAFLEDAGGVFRRVIDAAVAVGQESGTPGHRYAFGVDWGRTGDFTAISVLDATENSIVYLDRFNQIGYTVQLDRLRALAERFRPESIIAERNSMGQPLVERLQETGLPVQPFLTTQASKQQAIDALALAFERGDLRIIADTVLVSELQAYEATALPSGLLRYSAPEGMHDDTVISTALAWQAVVAPTDAPLVTPGMIASSIIGARRR